jgi:hypothetical protein
MASRKLITKEYQTKSTTDRMNPTLCSRPWLSAEVAQTPAPEVPAAPAPRKVSTKKTGDEE